MGQPLGADPSTEEIPIGEYTLEPPVACSPLGQFPSMSALEEEWYVICSCRLFACKFVKARDLKEKTGWLFGATVSVSAVE